MVPREALGPCHGIQASNEVVVGIDNVSHHDVQPIISFSFLCI